jgi:hypothetical protein
MANKAGQVKTSRPPPLHSLGTSKICLGSLHHEHRARPTRPNEAPVAKATTRISQTLKGPSCHRWGTTSNVCASSLPNKRPARQNMPIGAPVPSAAAIKSALRVLMTLPLHRKHTSLKNCPILLCTINNPRSPRHQSRHPWPTRRPDKPARLPPSQHLKTPVLHRWGTTSNVCLVSLHH